MYQTLFMSLQKKQNQQIGQKNSTSQTQEAYNKTQTAKEYEQTHKTQWELSI